MTKKLFKGNEAAVTSAENMEKIKAKAKAQIGKMRSTAGNVSEPDSLCSGDLGKYIKDRNLGE